MGSIKDEIRLQAQIAELRAANARLLQRMERLRVRREELVAAVYNAAKDAAMALEIPPVPSPRPDKRKSKIGEVAVVVLSDWQLGKVTPTYSTEVCERRVRLMAEKVLELTDIQRADHPVRECRVYLLGDIVEGELIFPGQAFAIDSSLYRQVLVDGPRILGNFIRTMLSHFDTVVVDGCIGNHGSLGGRARREYHPESNADAMLYEATRLVLLGDDGSKEPRLTWKPNYLRGERKWYSVDQVGRHAFLLFHGDQIKGGFAGYSWYGFAKKILAWTRSIPERFNYSLAGHFHVPVRMYVNKGLTHWSNGSTESDNTYAQEQLAAAGDPTQWLLFCHPERGVTAEYLVDLSGA